MSLLDLVKSPVDRVPRPRPVVGQIRELADPARVIIPLEYPGQVLFQPTVAVGDAVTFQQEVGRSDRGSCIHASVSGTVREFRTVWTPSSHHVPAVVIDREDRPGEAPAEPLAYLHRPSRGALLRAGGVLSPWTSPGWLDHEEDVDSYPEARHVVLVGYDEEPTINVNEALLLEHGERMKAGLERLRDLAPRAVYRVLVRNALVSEVRSLFGDDMEVVGVSDAYEKRLLRLLVPHITGEDLTHTDTFREHGIAVLSVEQAFQLLDAVQGRPVTRKTITVAGAGLDKPVTVRTALGTTVADVLAALDLDDTGPARVVIGGPMQGKAIADLDTPIDKFSHGLFLVAAHQLPSERNLICIHCGRCTRACPVDIQVHLLGRAVEFNAFKQAREYHPEVCLECGLCAFVCPSHRPLVQLVRIAKQFEGKAS